MANNPFNNDGEMSSLERAMYLDNPANDVARQRASDLAIDAEMARLSREFARRKATDLTYVDTFDNEDAAEPQQITVNADGDFDGGASDAGETFERDLAANPFDDNVDFDPSELGPDQPLPVGGNAIDPLRKATRPSMDAMEMAGTRGAAMDLGGNMMRNALRRLVRSV